MAAARSPREAEEAARSSREPGSPGSRDLETTIVLLERVRRGERRATERLVRRYMPELLRWAHGRLPHYCRPLDDTQTLVLDSLESALSHLEKFEYRREGAFLSYLRTIFMNKLRDKARKPRQQFLPETDVPGTDSPEDDMVRTEFWGTYDKALAALPERMREAVILRLELDWSFARIATAIHSPTANAARMYVTRGIRRLASEMNHAAA